MRTIIIAAILALTALACSNQENPEPITQIPIQKAEPTKASAPTITPGEPADTRAHLPQPEEGTKPFPLQAHTETPVPFRIQKAEPQPLETGAATPADATSDTTITLTGELAGMTITNDDNFPAIPQESLEQLAGSISVLAEAPEPVSAHITRISPFFQVKDSTEHPLEITYSINPSEFPQARIEISLYQLRERKNSRLSDKWNINGDGTLQGTMANPTYVNLEPGLGGTYFFGYEGTAPHLGHDPSDLPMDGPQAPVRIGLDPPNAPITVNPNEPMPTITVRVTRADGSTTILDPQNPDLSFEMEMDSLKVTENGQLAWEGEPRPFYHETITAAYQGLTASKTITEKLPIATIPQVGNECLYQRPGGETPIKANRVAVDGGTYPFWESTQRGSIRFQHYGKRREKPQDVISFECNSAEDFRQFHQDLRANPGIRYQEPYLPSEAEAAIRVMNTYHYSDNLSGTIPMDIRITQQDGMTRDINEEDLPGLTITSSDESVIRINQEGQPEPVRVGRADLHINLRGKDATIRNVPVFPIAIDEQCRIWSYRLAGIRIPEYHVTGYAYTDYRFQAEPPIPPEILEEIAHHAGWATIRTEGENEYHAVLGMDCHEEPRRTAREFKDKLEKTWKAMDELIPETRIEHLMGSIATGDMNTTPFQPHWPGAAEDYPMQRDVYLQSQDHLVELQPIQAWPSRFDPGTGLHFRPNNWQEREEKVELTTQTPEIILAGPEGYLGVPIRAGAARLTLATGGHTFRKEFQVHEQPKIRVDVEPRCSGEIMGVRYAQDQILIRLNDSVENHGEFIWAVAGSSEIRGDVIGRGENGWYIIRTVCPEKDSPETVFATALFLLTESHKYVRNAAPRSLP